MFDKTGQKTWEAELDIYGKVRKLAAGSLNDCPFRYQGQYEDVETGLYYNRFRYYDPEDGVYVSQDPISLSGGMPNMYAYVHEPNKFVDPTGLIGLEEGGQSVYGLFDAGAKEPYYIGISNDPERRAFEHMDSGRLSDTGRLEVLGKDLKYKEARGKEQFLIEKHNTKTGKIGEEISATNRGNKVNSFDKTRTDTRGKVFKAEYDKAKGTKKPHAGCKG